MQSRPLRIIIDTNLWISSLITKDYTKLKSVLSTPQVTLLVSNELFSELITVTQKQKLQKYFSKFEIGLLIELFDEYATYINVNTQLELCRDFKDNFLLNLAIDGDADYLITGDNDLLVLKTQGRTEILTMANFLLKLTH